MLVNIFVYRGHHTQLLQLRAAELIPHVTLSVQCATVRRYTLKWHQILFITENEILGFPAFTGRVAPCACKRLGRACTCRRCRRCVYTHPPPPLKWKTVTHALSEEVFFASLKGHWEVKCLGEQTSPLQVCGCEPLQTQHNKIWKTEQR